MFRVDDRPLKAIKRRNCLISDRVGSIPVHVQREKSKNEISEDTSSGKSTEVLEEVEGAIQVERAQPSEEKKPDNLHLELLLFKAATETQGSAMSEKEDNTLTESMVSTKIVQVNLHHAKTESALITRVNSKDNIWIMQARKPSVY